MDPIISVKNLNFTYNKGKDNEYQALISTNLDIYPEEFIIIFGPSGCGKSTLLNVIAGLETPDTGSCLVFGKDLMAMNKLEYAQYHRSQVGMIYQAYNLIHSLTVLDNVALPQIFLSVSKRKREKWTRTLLDRFGILPQADKIPTELSGGQQQRIGIARAIVNNPQIVLADEPVGNLDSVSARNVLEILRDLNDKEKKTVVMVTHNPEHLPYGDRIIHMKDGLITGETVNRDRNLPASDERKLAPKPPSAEIQDLMRAYHGLSPEQINILIMPYKAKIFSHHFISNRNMEETKTLEEVIQRRLLGTISQEEFMDVINRPADEGGVGFDVRTAQKVLRKVNRVIRMAYFIYQKSHQRKAGEGSKHEKVTDEEKVDKLVYYLLKSCYNDYYKSLDEVKVNRLKKAVRDRLSGQMQKTEFFTFLDQPFSEGGIGLNTKTARAITEEIELVLIVGFGIVRELHGELNISPSPPTEEETGGKPAADGVSPAAGSDGGAPEAEAGAVGTDEKSGAALRQEALTQVAKMLAENGDFNEFDDNKEAEADNESEPNASPEAQDTVAGYGDAEIEAAVSAVLADDPDAGMIDFARVMNKTVSRLGPSAAADDERVIAAVKKALTRE